MSSFLLPKLLKNHSPLEQFSVKRWTKTVSKYSIYSVCPFASGLVCHVIHAYAVNDAL